MKLSILFFPVFLVTSAFASGPIHLNGAPAFELEQALVNAGAVPTPLFRIKGASAAHVKVGDVRCFDSISVCKFFEVATNGARLGAEKTVGVADTADNADAKQVAAASNLITQLWTALDHTREQRHPAELKIHEIECSHSASNDGLPWNSCTIETD